MNLYVYGPFVVIYVHVRMYACVDGCLDVSVCGCAHGYMDMDAWAFLCMDVRVDIVFFFVSASLAACLLSFFYECMMLCLLMFASVSAHLSVRLFVWLGLGYTG